MVLKPIDSVPIGKQVLLYWKESNHFEEGTVYDGGDDETGVYHTLFDGQSLNFHPTHWADLSEFIFEQ